MKIKGSKNAIKRVIDCLKADYNYYEGKPLHKHFFRVFEVVDEEELVDNKDGTFTKYVFGYCAWSVHSAMTEGGYYKSIKEEYKNTFMGTTLKEQSKDCEIEVFSEEVEGCFFSEHYLYKNGECLVDTCCEIEQYGYTKTGKLTKRINWDTYEGDIEYLSDNRTGVGCGFKWAIE